MTDKFVASIMIGGQSKRMGGGIKSFLEFNEKKIFDRIFERLKPQIKTIIINCNSKDLILQKYKIPIIQDIKQGYLGPLAGIHSAMSWIKKNNSNAEWLITIPGDTPFIPSDLINRFKNKISTNKKIILAKSKNKIHPIIGVWHISLFNNLDNEINNGVRKILTWANKHSIDYVNYSTENYDPFFNINTKYDLDLAINIEKIILKKNE